MSETGRPVSDRWHKGSRYWKVGAFVVLASDILAGVALWLVPEAAAAALGSAGGVSMVFLGGAGAMNYQERKNGRIRDDLP